MPPVREVYIVLTTSIYTNIPCASPSSSIGTTLTNTAEIQNKVNPLYDKKGTTIVGKNIVNKNLNYFGNNNGGFVNNGVFLFNDGSYVMILRWVTTRTNDLQPNTIYVDKAISTGGKYAGKDVTVTLKTDNNVKSVKVIFEYEN